MSGQWADLVISPYHSNTLVNNYLILPLPPPSVCPWPQRSAEQASAEIRGRLNNEGLYSELPPWKETSQVLYMDAFKQQLEGSSKKPELHPAWVVLTNAWNKTENNTYTLPKSQPIHACMLDIAPETMQGRQKSGKGQQGIKGIHQWVPLKSRLTESGHYDPESQH